MLSIDITSPARVVISKATVTTSPYSGRTLSVGFDALNERGYEAASVGLFARLPIVADIALGWLEDVLDAGWDGYEIDDPEWLLALSKRLSEAAQAAWAERHPAPVVGEPRD